MGKFKDYGIMHFGIECDMFLAHNELYKTASQFLTEAIQKEDCGYDLAEKFGWNQTEAFYKLIPFVRDNGYVVNRIGYWFYGESSDPHFEFVKNSGRGHVRVWYIDMEEVKKSLEKVREPHGN